MSNLISSGKGIGCIGTGNINWINSQFLTLNEGLFTVIPSTLIQFPSIKLFILFLENEKLFKFNCCFVGSLTLIASVTQVSNLLDGKHKSFTLNEILIGVVMSNKFNPKVEKTSTIISNIKLIKIIAIILGLLIIMGLVFLFWGLANNYSELANKSSERKLLKKNIELATKFDFNEPLNAQLISSSLGPENNILLRYIYEGKNTLVVLDIKTKQVKYVITIKKGQNNFKIN